VKILFVDDEKNVLQGLRRSLRSMRREWDMTFVESGAEAVTTMKSAEEPFGIVVSDMRMPGMDGSEVLYYVRQNYPDTLRFALSGGTDDKITYRTTHVAHQFLSKPCDSETLKAVLQGGEAIIKLMETTPLRKILTSLSTIPSMPHVVVELERELRRDEPSMKRIGTIIAGDIGMTAKILQLVNSAFFGVSHPVNNAEQAVTMLGLDTIKALVLTVGIFTSFDAELFPEFNINRIWAHGLAVGKAAKEICLAESTSETVAEDALLAGTLHDIGKIVLASYTPLRYREVLAQSKEAEALIEVEKQALGATHAEAGAYVLGTWGLQSNVVYAIGLHHYPKQLDAAESTVTAAVHAANAAWHEFHGNDTDKYDQEFIDGLFSAGTLERWKELCHTLYAKEAPKNG